MEVVSPANRRQADYEAAVVARALDYGIGWVLVVDPDAQTARWTHHGTASAVGPSWATSVDAGALWPS